MASSMNLDDYFKCNNDTPFVNHIVKALRENIIGEPEEKHKLLNITMLCLFSGPTPTCEYYICKKLKELYISIKTMNVILIDIYCPRFLIDESTVEIYKNILKQKFNIDNITCYNFAVLNELLKNNESFLGENTYCIGLNPQHNNKPAEGAPYGKPSDKIFPGHPYYNIHLGMYEFFNTYWLNRPVLYAFRGNPPPIVIFCPTVDQPYEGLTKLYSLTGENFDINKVFNMNNNNNKVLKNETGNYKSNIVKLCLPLTSGGSKKKISKTNTKTKKKTRKNINLHKSKKNKKYNKHYKFI